MWASNANLQEHTHNDGMWWQITKKPVFPSIMIFWDNIMIGISSENLYIP
jgi:hypothetical protein